MPWESIGDCGEGEWPDDRDWILAQYEIAITWLRHVCGPPPKLCELGVYWGETDKGEYPSGLGIGTPSGVGVPWEYISRCERALSAFDDAMKWSAIRPETVRAALGTEEPDDVVNQDDCDDDHDDDDDDHHDHDEEAPPSLHRVALSVWHRYGIGHTVQIHVAPTASELLSRMKPSLLFGLEMLLDEHWESIQTRDPQALHEQFGDGAYPQDGWSTGDVFAAFTALVDKRIGELVGKEDPHISALGEWSDLLAVLPSHWEAPDYFLVPLEGDPVTFTARLLAERASEYWGERVLSFQEGKWVTQLSRLTSADDWWSDASRRSAVLQLLEELADRETDI